jgi:hypothetical protein
MNDASLASQGASMRLRYGAIWVALFLTTPITRVVFAADARSSAPRDLRPIVLRWQGGANLNQDEVRRALGRELEAPIVLPDEGAASTARGSLTVYAFGDHVEIVFRNIAGKETRRTVTMPSDPHARIATIALIAGNLARDEAGDVLWKLETEPSAPPTPPTNPEAEVVIAPPPPPVMNAPVAPPSQDAPFRSSPASKIVSDAEVAALFAPVVDGEVGQSCASGCSKSLARGSEAMIHAAYEFNSGFGIGVEAGYAALSQTLSNRPETIYPMGFHGADGLASDRLTLHGAMVGLSASLRRGDRFPFLVRLGGGVLAGTASDTRSGTFTFQNESSNDPPTQTFSIDAVPATPSESAHYVYVAPEARIGYRFTDHIEVSAGVAAQIFFATGALPKWFSPKDSPNAWQIPTGTSEQSLGSASFDTQSFFGGTLVVIAPSIGLRCDF